MFCCCCRNDTAALEDDAESIKSDSRQNNGEKNNRIENTDENERTERDRADEAERILYDTHGWCIPDTHVSSLIELNNLICYQDTRCVVDVKRVLDIEIELRNTNKKRKQDPNVIKHYKTEMEKYENSVKRILSRMLIRLEKHWLDQYMQIAVNKKYKDLVNELEPLMRVPSRRVSNPPTSVRTPSRERRERRSSVPVLSSRNLSRNLVPN